MTRAQGVIIAALLLLDPGRQSRVNFFEDACGLHCRSENRLTCAAQEPDEPHTPMRRNKPLMPYAVLMQKLVAEVAASLG